MVSKMYNNKNLTNGIAMFICVNTSIDYPTKQFIHDICQALCTIEMKTVVSKVFYKKVLITHTRGFQPFHAIHYLSQGH